MHAWKSTATGLYDANVTRDRCRDSTEAEHQASAGPLLGDRGCRMLALKRGCRLVHFAISSRHALRLGRRFVPGDESRTKQKSKGVGDFLFRRRCP